MAKNSKKPVADDAPENNNADDFSYDEDDGEEGDSSPIPGFKIIVDPVRTVEKKHGKVGEALVRIGVLPIIYSKLAIPTHPTDDDDYVIKFKLTREQRQAIIAALSPAAVEIAKIRGLALTEKEAESILRNKLKELDEEGAYGLSADHKVAFFSGRPQNEEGKVEPRIVTMPVKGPDDETIEKPFLTKGSEGMANFILTLTQNQKTGKINLPFRLKAVKVSKPVFYEKKDGPSYDDFSGLEAGY